MCASRPAPVVLIVEDEGLVRTLIASEFASQGWVVLEADKGEGAVELLKDNHVDIVFTDIQLAGVITGWEVAEAMRRANPSAPVIYASGNASDKSRQVAGSLFFDKPYDPDAVIAACGKLLPD
jgi:CheY-like chemotaxis protein